MDSVVRTSSQHTRLLVVCTGNLARSPMAQRLLSQRLGERWLVDSAGTQADDGRPMAEHAREALMEVDVTPGEFRSRRLTTQMIESSDLVLTATREHRAEVLREVPTAMRRTFTLGEFARLVENADLDETPAASTPEIASRAAALRGQLWLSGDDFDIDDPYGHDLDVYRACRDRIIQSVDAIVPALKGVGA